MSRILQTVLKHKLTISIAQIFSCRHQVCNVLQPLRNKILTLFTNSSNFLFRRILIMNRITTGKFQLGVQQNNKVSRTNQSHHFKYLLCFSRLIRRAGFLLQKKQQAIISGIHSFLQVLLSFKTLFSTYHAGLTPTSITILKATLLWKFHFSIDVAKQITPISSR